jgi:hypothetical protein
MDSEEKFESALQARDGQGVDNPLKKRRPYVKPAFEYEPVVEAVAAQVSPLAQCVSRAQQSNAKSASGRCTRPIAEVLANLLDYRSARRGAWSYSIPAKKDPASVRGHVPAGFPPGSTLI